MSNDAELLRIYATHGSEPAFAELVHRHLDLVYFAALRRCRGDAHLAEDVAQQVFTLLARDAAALAGHAVLAGWLYVTTRNVASKLMRAEDSRRAREYAAPETPAWVADADPSAHVDWEQLRPVLDGALDQLGERDRDAVLLRFFENRAFAEIGQALRVTDDAARMRVERALGKLRALLERRGIRSTDAALGLALANYALHGKPAGLAASVTASALAGAAASGSLAGAAALTGIGFMSTLKFSGGAAAAVALLLASLAGNAYLAFGPARANAAAVRTGDAARATGVAVPPQTASTPPTTLVKNADLAALRDRMRAAGANETAVRAALEGILWQRYREQQSRNIAARLQHWWRDGQRTWGTAHDTQLPFPDLRLMHEMIDQPLEALLGVDPLAVAEAEERYAFLPPEMRAAFGRLDRANIGGFSTTGNPEEDARIRKDFFEQGRRRAAERQELVASLAPEQRNEYEMRFGTFASGLRRQLENLVVAEPEFRALFPLADRYAKDLEAVRARDDPNAAKLVLDREYAQQLIQSLGYDRALDYIWAGALEYPSVARVARDAGLPPQTAGQVVQLAAETASRAMALHQDAAKSLEQKRAGLLELQRAARAQLEAWLPANVQQRLAPHSLAWLNQLSEDRYKAILTTLPGQVRTTTTSAPVSIEEPPGGRSHVAGQLLPQRPAGK